MANSTHRAQLGFLVELTRPLCDDDKDLLARRYIDIYDNLVGEYHRRAVMKSTFSSSIT